MSSGKVAVFVKGVNHKDVEEVVNVLLPRFANHLPLDLAPPGAARLRFTIMDIQILRAVTILRELDDIELQAFYELLEFREVRAEERILEEGTVVENFCIIFDGAVHIRRLAQSREMLMGRLGPGGFFGEINLFDPGVATASIYAVQRTLLAMVTYDRLRAFFAENPATGYKRSSPR